MRARTKVESQSRSSLGDGPNEAQVGDVDPAARPATTRAGSTRASRAWIGVAPALVLLAIVLLFVFQNLHRSQIRFVTISATVPLAVALFAAAACGGLFVLALGSVRIVQLRKVIRRQHRATGVPQ
jgi:uncharacterized integral membrane protein